MFSISQGTFLLFLLALFPPFVFHSSLPPEFNQILDEAKKIQITDISTWKEFQFQRQAVTEHLDERGNVLNKEFLIFQVTPISSGFDEKLISINDRKPRPQEIEHYRKLARFNKNYNKMLTNSTHEEVHRDRIEGFSLRALLNFSFYHYIGEEKIGDVPCYRLDFEPNRIEAGSSIESRFKQAMAGSLWISIDGYHIVCAKARIVKPIFFAFNLAQINSLDITLESNEVGSGIWLPHRIEIKSTLKVLWKDINKRTLLIYSDFFPLMH